MWVLLRPTGLLTLKGCETGPPAYRPYQSTGGSVGDVPNVDFQVNVSLYQYVQSLIFFPSDRDMRFYLL